MSRKDKKLVHRPTVHRPTVRRPKKEKRKQGNSMKYYSGSKSNRREIGRDIKVSKEGKEVGSSITPTSLHVTKRPQTVANREEKM